MDLKEAAALAKLKLLEYKLNDWTFRWNKRKTHCGVCVYSRKAICLSVSYVSLNPITDVLDTILHEIAHALTGPGVGHSQPWKEMCAKVGATPSRIATSPVVTIDTFRHHYRCPKCGCVFRTHRRLKNEKNRFHSKCGSQHKLIKVK